jgi:hypothetical protein
MKTRLPTFTDDQRASLEAGTPNDRHYAAAADPDAQPVTADMAREARAMIRLAKAHRDRARLKEEKRAVEATKA